MSGVGSSSEDRGTEVEGFKKGTSGRSSDVENCCRDGVNRRREWTRDRDRSDREDGSSRTRKTKGSKGRPFVDQGRLTLKTEGVKHVQEGSVGAWLDPRFRGWVREGHGDRISVQETEKT